MAEAAKVSQRSFPPCYRVRIFPRLKDVPPTRQTDMNRIFGYLVGIVWLGMAFGAYQTGAQGRALGQDDVGFWWSVIGTILAIAAMGALVGTTIHTRGDSH